MLWMQNWWFFRIVSFRSIPSSFIYLSSYSSWRIRWFLCIFNFNLVFGEGKKAYNYRIKCLFYYWRKWWNNYMVKCDQQEKIPLVIPDEWKWKWKCIIKHNTHTHTRSFRRCIMMRFKRVAMARRFSFFLNLLQANEFQQMNNFQYANLISSILAMILEKLNGLFLD